MIYYQLHSGALLYHISFVVIHEQLELFYLF